MDRDEILKRLQDPVWRLSHLYKIRDKAGESVIFKPNAIQSKILFKHHNRNVIPKARQHGVTTAVCLYMLDRCLDPLKTNAVRCSIIAHREGDAHKIFDSKIRYPLQCLPDALKDEFPSVVRITAGRVDFSDGSCITADTMVRSDTINILHVSELGKMAAWYPLKAQEVRTGAFPAAERGEIFVESTMEGATGLMADLCRNALDLQRKGTPLGPKDWKFTFFPWFNNPGYIADTIPTLDDNERKYFDGLSGLGIELSEAQKSWYVGESRILGEKMRQEYPSTFEESIETSTEGAWFGQNMAKARVEGRICRVAYDSHIPVYASMDIGYGDPTAIWIYQVLHKEIHFIDYYQVSGEPLSHYITYLQRLPYAIQAVILPHDAGAHEKATGLSYEDQVKGYNFRTVLLERDAHEILGIDLARSMFSRCWFDQDKCSQGLQSLCYFSREWDRQHSRWLGKSKHDEYSDGAKSFIYACKGISTQSRHGDDYTADEIREQQLRHRPWV